MSRLDMCMFVFDYDYNASVEGLRATHKRLYEIIRKNNPDIPYLIISKPDYVYDQKEGQMRWEIKFDIYCAAIENGDGNVYYIDGSTFIMVRDCNNCFSDCVHPNGIGFLKMADKIEPIISGAYEKWTHERRV